MALARPGREGDTHQTSLRAFATTGHPPTASGLDAVTVGSGRSDEVLTALHDACSMRRTKDWSSAMPPLAALNTTADGPADTPTGRPPGFMAGAILWSPSAQGSGS